MFCKATGNGSNKVHLCWTNVGQKNEWEMKEDEYCTLIQKTFYKTTQLDKMSCIQNGD